MNFGWGFAPLAPYSGCLRAYTSFFNTCSACPGRMSYYLVNNHILKVPCINDACLQWLWTQCATMYCQKMPQFKNPVYIHVHAQESCACTRILCMHKDLLHAHVFKNIARRPRIPMQRPCVFKIPCIMDACPRGAEYLCNNNIFKSPMFLKSPCIKTWGVNHKPESTRNVLRAEGTVADQGYSFGPCWALQGIHLGPVGPIHLLGPVGPIHLLGPFICWALLGPFIC